MENKVEIWKSLPGVPGVEVSTFGRVRTLDRVVPIKNRMYHFKGRVLKPASNGSGYLTVAVKVNDKFISKTVHRLVAQAFIPNPDNLPEINHKDCDRANNSADNLEWVTHDENIAYRDKYGNKERNNAPTLPVFAIDLTTLEVSHFRSQNQASRVLGLQQSNVNAVIKGRIKQTGGFWFKKDEGNGIEIDKDKLNDIVTGMRFRVGIFAVNLNTLEVSRFSSQTEASRELGLQQSSISAVIKGRQKTANGYWFVNDDGHAVDVVKNKLHDIGGIGLKIK